MNPETEEEISNENQTASEADNASLDSVLAQSANDIPPIAEPISAMNAVPPADRTGGTANPAGGDAVTSPVKRGRGRPKKEGKDTPPSGSAPPRPKLSGVQQPPAPGDEAIEPCAQILTMMTNASGMVLAQGEVGAMTPEEQMLVKGGYVAYLKAKGVTNVPAWVILAGSLSPYYLRIITTTPAKTTVASGLRKAWFGIKEFFIKRKNKNAHANSRPDVKRENNPSEKTGEENI